MRKDNKVFIPLTLDNSTKTAWGTQQFLGVGGAAVFAVFLQIFLLIFYEDYSGLTWMAHPIVLVSLDIALLYFTLWLVRKFIFKENELLKAYENNKHNEIADLSFLWDIFNIEDGKIYYLNGYVARVVQFKHGYVYDRPSMHEDIHRKSVQNAIASLARKGYIFKFYNREVKDSNLEPLYVTKQRISGEAGSPQFNLITDILNHTERVCSDIATIEVETFVIIAPDMYTIQGLDLATEEMIAATRSGLYSFAHKLSTNEIYDFICSLYEISSIDSDGILSRKFRNSKLEVVRELEVYRTEEVETVDKTDYVTPHDDEYMKEFEQMLAFNQQKSTDDEGDYL